jgi:hypothetical protein
MFESEFFGGLGNFFRFGDIRYFRLGFGYGAKTTATRANIAEYQKGYGFFGETFSAIGTKRRFTNRVYRACQMFANMQSVRGFGYRFFQPFRITHQVSL